MVGFMIGMYLYIVSFSLILVVLDVFFFHVLILKNLRECCFLIQGFSNDWRGLVRTCYGRLGACCKRNHGESGVLVSFIHSNNQLFEKSQLGDVIKFQASKIYKKFSKLV